MSPGELAINRSILLQDDGNGLAWRWLALIVIVGVLSLLVAVWFMRSHADRDDVVTLPITPVDVIPASTAPLESTIEVATSNPQEPLGIQDQGDQVAQPREPELVVASVAQIKAPLAEVKRQITPPPVKPAPVKPAPVVASSPCARPFSANAVAMSAAGIRSVLPGVVSYVVGGVACSLKVGSALGEERVVNVDAELLRIHTDKRTIQLIDK